MRRRPCSGNEVPLGRCSGRLQPDDAGAGPPRLPVTWGRSSYTGRAIRQRWPMSSKTCVSRCCSTETGSFGSCSCFCLNLGPGSPLAISPAWLPIQNAISPRAEGRPRVDSLIRSLRARELSLSRAPPHQQRRDPSMSQCPARLDCYLSPGSQPPLADIGLHGLRRMDPLWPPSLRYPDACHYCHPPLLQFPPPQFNRTKTTKALISRISLSPTS